MDYSNLNIPNHVAIIVDGNGRWAKERGLSRLKGHDAGLENLKSLGKYILSKGINILSLYVFSTENFKREEKEVKHLMDLFVMFFDKEKKFFIENNIKVVFSGRDLPLPKKVIKARDELVLLTKNNTGGILNICLNYGGRSEIVDATRKIVLDKIDPSLINEELFSKYLYQDLDDVDLLIRTSGEVRLSNFLLWQLSYSELYFIDTKFPDFKEEDFDKSFKESLKCNQDIMVEEFIEGISSTVGVLDIEDKTIATEILEFRTKKEWYDYECKYTEGMTEFILPAQFTKELTNKIKEIAINSHKFCKCKSVSRVDFLVDKNNTPYVLEINTSPGMTDLSDLPAQAKAIGLSYDDLVLTILNGASLNK